MVGGDAVGGNKMCWLWFHNWTKWEIKEEGHFLYDGQRKGNTLLQQRKCYRCEYVQIRMDKVSV